MSSESRESSHNLHIGVIGGGITGLTAAYRLSQLGYRVTLWEQSEELGGLAAAIPVPGGHLEKFYHHLFMSDRAISELINELGIGNHLVWLPSQNSYYAAGRTFSLASPLDLLRLPVVPLIDRLRVGFVTLYLQRISTKSGRWHQFEQVTAWDWLRRKVGRRAFHRMFGAQLRAKFGPRAEEIAMVWFWNKIYLRTQSRPGLFGKERLGYITGSFNVLIQRLAEACKESGVDIRVGVGTDEVLEREGPACGFAISDTSGYCTETDAVVVTISAPLVLKLFPKISEPYRSKLTSTKYQGAVCMLLRTDRKLSDTYWLNIADPRVPFTVIVEHTNFIDPSHYQGNHYTYVNKYVEWDHPYVTMSDDELREEYFQHLKAVYPEFDPDWVKDVWIFRAPAAQPIIGLHYADHLPSHHTPIDGVYLATMSQIYPEDRGTNYAVELGNRITEIVHQDLGVG